MTVKIPQVLAAQLAEAYGRKGTRPLTSAEADRMQGAARRRADAAQLSGRARSFLAARRALLEAEDTRSGLVSELRAKVRDGRYQVDDNALARALHRVLGTDR